MSNKEKLIEFIKQFDIEQKEKIFKNLKRYIDKDVILENRRKIWTNF